MSKKKPLLKRVKSWLKELIVITVLLSAWSDKIIELITKFIDAF